MASVRPPFDVLISSPGEEETWAGCGAMEGSLVFTRPVPGCLPPYHHPEGGCDKQAGKWAGQVSGPARRTSLCATCFLQLLVTSMSPKLLNETCPSMGSGSLRMVAYLAHSVHLPQAPFTLGPFPPNPPHNCLRKE